MLERSIPSVCLEDKRMQTFDCNFSKKENVFAHKTRFLQVLDYYNFCVVYLCMSLSNSPKILKFLHVENHAAEFCVIANFQQRYIFCKYLQDHSILLVI